jgi:hypothetical protein
MTESVSRCICGSWLAEGNVCPVCAKINALSV